MPAEKLRGDWRNAPSLAPLSDLGIASDSGAAGLHPWKVFCTSFTL